MVLIIAHLLLTRTIFLHLQRVTAEMYQDIMRQFIALFETEDRDCQFQQDGALAHTAAEILSFLAKFFQKCIISVGCWLAHSTDLSHPDFFP